MMFRSSSPGLQPGPGVVLAWTFISISDPCRREGIRPVQHDPWKKQLQTSVSWVFTDRQGRLKAAYQATRDSEDTIARE